MENKLFRQKSIDRVSSPEQLQDYMRVTNPGVWMIQRCPCNQIEDNSFIGRTAVLSVCCIRV